MGKLKVESYNFFAFGVNWLFLFLLASPFIYFFIENQNNQRIEEARMVREAHLVEVQNDFFDQINLFITNKSGTGFNFHINQIKDEILYVKKINNFGSFVTHDKVSDIFTDENIDRWTSTIETRNLDKEDLGWDSPYDNHYESESSGTQVLTILGSDYKVVENRNPPNYKYHLAFVPDEWGNLKHIYFNVDKENSNNSYDVYKIVYYQSPHQIFWVGTNNWKSTLISQGLINKDDKLSLHNKYVLSLSGRSSTRGNVYLDARKIYFKRSGRPFFFKNWKQSQPEEIVLGKSWVDNSLQFLWEKEEGDLDYLNSLDLEK
tara:strand:+ start:941 stop:1894 length:954 start_codon:yes stop_codon:yes gene_type:complete